MLSDTRKGCAGLSFIQLKEKWNKLVENKWLEKKLVGNELLGKKLVGKKLVIKKLVEKKLVEMRTPNQPNSVRCPTVHPTL